MGGFEEIAATGSPALVTVLGMGTVFVCLTLLYLMTRLLARSLPGLLASARPAPVVEARASAAGSEAQQSPPGGETSGREAEGVATAIAIALTRHRSSRARAEIDVSRGAGPWKVAGRLRALRDR